MSAGPLLAIGVLWVYLVYHGVAVKTTWLCLNLLETLRALRTVRANGRRVGESTRNQAMRNSLRGWVVYIAMQYAGTLPNTLFGWMPMYPTIRGVMVAGFLLTRAASSASIYDAAITPLLQRYETPIDLTLMFIHAVGLLVWYNLVVEPVHVLRDGAMWAYQSARRLSPPTPAPIVESPTVDTDSLEAQPQPPAPSTRSSPSFRCPRSPSITILPSSPVPPPSPSLPPPSITSPVEPATPIPKAKLVVPDAPFTVRRSPRNHGSSQPAPVPKANETSHPPPLALDAAPTKVHAPVARKATAKPAPKRRAPSVRAANIPPVHPRTSQTRDSDNPAKAIDATESKDAKSDAVGSGRHAQTTLKAKSTQTSEKRPATTLASSIEKHASTAPGLLTTRSKPTRSVSTRRPDQSAREKVYEDGKSRSGAGDNDNGRLDAKAEAGPAGSAGPAGRAAGRSRAMRMAGPSVGVKRSATYGDAGDVLVVGVSVGASSRASSRARAAGTSASGAGAGKSTSTAIAGTAAARKKRRVE